MSPPPLRRLGPWLVLPPALAAVSALARWGHVNAATAGFLLLLVVLGISLWFQRHVRTFAGTAAILLALVSIPVSNLGGFGFGFLLSLIGGALAIAWAPGQEEERVSSTYKTPSRAAAAPGTAPQGTASENTAQPGAVPLVKGDAPEPATADSTSGAARGEGDDLSGTTPTNGTNGRHSAG